MKTKQSHLKIIVPVVMTMYTVRDKVAIVTGAGNGIGASIVKELLQEDAKFVAILDIDEIAGKRVENETVLKYGKGKARFFKCDVTDVKELYGVFDTVFEENGYIDVVINNAGICNEAPDMFIKEIEINFTAVVSSSLKALQLMRKDHGGNGGTIINISSVTALSQNVGIFHIYAATKSAVLNFSNRFGLDKYYSATNVRVLTVCIGATYTNMFENCKGFDEIADKDVVALREALVKNSMQKAEDAARGVIEAYNKGKSGSTWLVSMKKIVDITNKVRQADAITAAVGIM